jgi:hypothetical protein
VVLWEQLRACGRFLWGRSWHWDIDGRVGDGVRVGIVRWAQVVGDEDAQLFGWTSCAAALVLNRRDHGIIGRRHRLWMRAITKGFVVDYTWDGKGATKRSQDRLLKGRTAWRRARRTRRRCRDDKWAGLLTVRGEEALASRGGMRARTLHFLPFHAEQNVNV